MYEGLGELRCSLCKEGVVPGGLQPRLGVWESVDAPPWEKGIVPWGL